MSNNTEIKISSSIKIPKRNNFGLLESVNYIFSEDGTINWRKMIKSEYLTPHKQVFEKKNNPVPSSIDGLDDRELLILLGGIKELAQLRGFTSVKYRVTAPTNDYVISVCQINWIPNYETEGLAVEFSGIGDANPSNTNGIGKNYLGPIAENRSFVRCVRNFLKIHIVSEAEIGGNFNSDNPENPTSSLLRNTMTESGVTFELIKQKLVEEKFDGAENFKIIDDIPRVKQFELIERIKKKASEKIKKSN